MAAPHPSFAAQTALSHSAKLSEVGGGRCTLFRLAAGGRRRGAMATGGSWKQRGRGKMEGDKNVFEENNNDQLGA